MHEIFRRRCFEYYAHGGHVGNGLLYANSSNLSVFSLPPEDEAVAIGLVAVVGILWQGSLPPCVDAADTVDVEVYVDVDEVSSSDFMRMVRGEVFFAVVPCTDAEGLAAVDAEGVLV